MNRRTIGPLRSVLLLWLLHLPLAGAQTLALTFDDGLDPGTEARSAQWNARLLAHLQAAGLRSFLFPTLARTGGPGGKDLVRQWSEAGHPVGNHTSKHRSLASSRVPLEAFLEDVKEAEAEAAFGDLPTWTRRLRFPYLKEGDTVAKRDGLRQWMRANGYLPAPVSIDASDWYFNGVYLQWLAAGRQDRLDALRGAYVRHLLDRAAYYDGLARAHLGRSPAHVLLLHTNAINAAWLPDVIAAFRDAGWRFMAAADAFQDPLYAMSPDVLPAGESIVWSLAKASGDGSLRYPAEDSAYEEPALRALGLVP